MSTLKTYDFPTVETPSRKKRLRNKQSRKIGCKDTRTGFDDSGLYSCSKTISRSKAAKKVKTFIISLIPYPGVGSLQPRVIIPIILYLYLRNATIVTLAIFGWILLDLFVYVLFGVWSLGSLFGLAFHREWSKRLLKLKMQALSSAERKALKEQMKSKELKYRLRRKKTKPLNVDVMQKMGETYSDEKEVHSGALLTPVTHLGYPDEDSHNYVKKVDILAQAVLINTAVSFIALLFAFYAVRVFNMKIFAGKSAIGGVIVWQVIISCLIAGLQGGVISWLGNGVLIILLWALYAPVNGLYNESGASFYAPYIFLSVVLFVAIFAFSRVFVWIANQKVYPWPTDNRYIINSAYFLAIGFFVTSLVGVIKTG